VLFEGGTQPHYVSSGHLLFARGGAILAVPFDLRSLQVRGNPTPVIEGVAMSASMGVAQFAVSAPGTIAYTRGTDTNGTRALVWVDRHGAVQPIAAPRQNYEQPRLSPDGQRVAVMIRGGAGIGQDVWLFQLARGTLSRLSFESVEAETPAWTPDGRHVTYAVTRNSSPSRMFLWKPADGSGGDEPLAGGNQHLHIGNWSPRGDALVAFDTGGGDLWVMQAGDKRTWRPLAQTPFRERGPAFSPDGRWLAYASNETRRFEIYAQAFPGPGGKWQISTDGGSEPVWAKNGRELFYRNGDKMMAVPVETKGNSFEAGTPKLLFEGRFAPATPATSADAWYDVSADGKRFVMLKADEMPTTNAIVVVQDWLSELKRLGPGK
jgi:dipeptidyl aminopeptidase/acylaminoacyl peptidase